MSYHLKTRIAVAVSLLALGFMVFSSWLALRYFENNVTGASQARLANNLTTTAEGLQSRMDHARQLLATLRQVMPEEALSDQLQMQNFLESQRAALLTFDNGIFLFAADGLLSAVYPAQEDLVGMDFSTSGYITETLKTSLPVISKPFKSLQQHHHPIIMMTEPIVDEHRHVMAILAGSFDLYGNNFLHDMVKRNIDKDLCYLMIDQQGMMIVHPQQENILSASVDLLPPDLLEMIRQTDHGQTGVVKIGDVEMTGVYQKLSSPGWTIMSLLSQNERLQSIHRARSYFMISLFALSLITIIAVRTLSNRLTSPLLELAEKVRRQADRHEEPLGIDAGRYKELGDLATSIQLLMSDVNAKRKDLNDQLSFLQNLIDTIPGPIFYKDAQYRYLGCNEAFEDYIGIPRKELIGKTVFEIAPPDLAKVYHQADVDLWDHGGEQVYEASVKYADNSAHDVIFHKKLFRDTSGEPAGMIGTFLDITERKRSERALLASEKRFRLLVENAADAFFLHDQQGQILDVNQQALKSLGYSRSELLSMKVTDISMNFQLDELKKIFIALQDGYPLTLQDLYRCKNGNCFPVEVRICYTEQEGGMVISLARDISERKQNEVALQAALHDARLAKSQVDNILRSVADGLIVTDRRKRITHINQIAGKMLNVKADEVTGHPFTRLFSDRQLREQAKRYLSETDLESSHQYDFKVNLSEAKFPLIIQARSSMLRTESGKLAGVVTLLHDVTRERELDQIKSEFISTAAHEMRTPMSVIMGYIEMLQGSEEIGNFAVENQKEFLSEIYRKSESLMQIVDDLFDISRIEAGLPLPISLAPCHLNKVIHDVVNHYAKHSDKHRFKLELEDLTPVWADGNKMAQVFENLISNAVKYSPDGGEIRIRSHRVGNCLRIEIIDQGSGMSSEHIERIFDKFYRADSSDTAVRGLGLGMSIVKAIIDGHDGQIRVASTEGEGTCVTLDMPYTTSDPPGVQ